MFGKDIRRILTSVFVSNNKMMILKSRICLHISRNLAKKLNLLVLASHDSDKTSAVSEPKEGISRKPKKAFTLNFPQREIKVYIH